MTGSVVSAKHKRVQKVCTLWTHDENFSKDDVVLNGEKFSELPATSGSLIQILALRHVTAVRDFQTAAKAALKEGSHMKGDSTTTDASADTNSKRSRRGSVKITYDENGLIIEEGRDVDPEKSYVFVAKPMAADLKSKYPNLQVS
jgi:DEP domain-containing protein 5